MLACLGCPDPLLCSLVPSHPSLLPLLYSKGELQYLPSLLASVLLKPFCTFVTSSPILYALAPSPQCCSAGFCRHLCTHCLPPMTPFPCLQGSPGWAPPMLWVPSFSLCLSTLLSAPPANRFFLTCSSAFAHPLSSPCLFAS